MGITFVVFVTWEAGGVARISGPWRLLAPEEYMRTNRWGFGAVIALMIALPLFVQPLLAHHGNAAYDTTKTVKVRGTITDFEFINPHVIVFFEAQNDKGAVEKWQGELTSPNHLTRAGWTNGTLKPGDQVTLSGLRAKSGATTLWITKIVATDGYEIPLSPGE